MSIYLVIAGVTAASILSLIFSCLTYSLREFSRPSLAEFLGRHDGDKWYEPITDHVGDLIFLTACFRQFANILIWVLVFLCVELSGSASLFHWALAIVSVLVIAVVCSVAVPHAAAKFASAEIVGSFAPILVVMYYICSPLTQLMHAVEHVTENAIGPRKGLAGDQIEEEILSAVEEGEKEGIVDEQEREMIESVIEFRNYAAAHIMTAKHEIVGVNVDAMLPEVRKIMQESGHSRIPVFEGTLDKIIGVLYARDLLKYLGDSQTTLDIRATMRPAIVIPETMPLRDLLADFRMQQVHIAVVLNEYGSTAGIVTVEDVIEELIGEISDEHERGQPAMFRRIDERSAEADARIHIDELNRLLALNIPEDAGYETLGGFLTTSLSKIPEKGSTFDHDGAKFIILEAEPQRVKRVRIELKSEPVRAEPA